MRGIKMLKFIKENSYDIFKLFLSQIALAFFGLVMTMWTANISDQVFLIVGIFSVIFYIYLIYIIVHDNGAKDRPAVEAGRAKPNYLKGLYLSLCANALNIICGVMVVVFGFFLVYQQPAKAVDATGAETKLYYKIKGSDEIYPVEFVEYSDKTMIGLYSDSGDDVYIYDNGMRPVALKQSGSAGETLTPCDKDGNELELFSRSGDTLNIERSAVQNWATNLYGVPMVIATFTQAMYKAVHVTLFGNADWFYLVMPLPTIAACTLAYYLGVKGKRILFFLPELKDPKKKRMRY